MNTNNKSATLLIIIAILVVCVSVSNIFFFHFVFQQYGEQGATAESISKSNAFMKNDDERIGNNSNSNSNIVKNDNNNYDQKVQDNNEGNIPDSETTIQQKQIQNQYHKVAGLSCADHGGPSDEIAKEMIYWRDIEADNDYKSPFYDEEKYLTFEPDHGGFNNIRMAMETTLVLAHAMGRTLVLPPKKGMYLLGKGDHHEKIFDFNDFFHLDMIAMEHQGLNIITMEEFLKRKGVTGQLKSLTSGQVLKPPDGVTDWNGKDPASLWKYLEKVGKYPEDWNPSGCVAAIPASNDPKDVEELQRIFDEYIKKGDFPSPDKGDFEGNPTAVDAPTEVRLREMMAARMKLCIYDTELQKEELIHFKIDRTENARLLTHFYAFIFFQDWVSPCMLPSCFDDVYLAFVVMNLISLQPSYTMLLQFTYLLTYRNKIFGVKDLSVIT